MKFSSKFPSWKTLEDNENVDWVRYCNKNSETLGNEEIDLRYKNLLSWQNILGSRQIVADIEEKLTNQGKVLRTRGGISCIHLSLSSKWKPCHGAINSRPRNLRMGLEKYFRLHWSCRQLRVEARNRMLNWEIYFPIFSGTIHTILKIFSQCGLRKCRQGLPWKKYNARIFGQNFG